ncbi:hypothetical protein KY284_010334 [Solanum tuberosum]|nr:hypothetical protein KY284_010334 [Solanum tuberosum]
MKDLLLDLMLHYGGKWITKPLLVYDKKYVATRRDISADLLDYDKIVEEYTKKLGFVLVKQILVKGPSRKFYLLEGSEGIKTLQYLLNEQFKVVNFFAVDDFEEIIFAPNIIHHSEAYLVECEYGTDAETESDDDQSSDDEYNFDELELIKMLKSKEVNVDLSHYKELHPSMTFKDLNEARKIVNLYSLANSKPIVVEKRDRSRLRYCVRHIEANWMKRFRSGEMKKLLWWAAWSTYEEDFKDQLSALGALSKSAAKDLLKYPPQTWCRAYLDTI